MIVGPGEDERIGLGTASTRPHIKWFAAGGLAVLAISGDLFTVITSIRQAAAGKLFGQRINLVWRSTKDRPKRGGVLEKTTPGTESSLERQLFNAQTMMWIVRESSDPLERGGEVGCY
ncbi:hypothetical protein D9757_001102 [Collybiopsis confluens]|uniref:Uncharacterized protein n=1 Tax=Collybiopsis confluens TaxID=2823264 RepID=A0A8H5I1G6_9AGAR|nr:hypothetical protein D9757_001102 [Collybiopsis confluens]